VPEACARGIQLASEDSLRYEHNINISEHYWQPVPPNFQCGTSASRGENGQMHVWL